VAAEPVCDAVYFLGRQVDDAKAYTSPLYVTFR